MDKFEEQVESADLEELEHEFDQVCTFYTIFKPTNRVNLLIH